MLEALDRDKWDGLPSRGYRQKGPYDATTVAMHWDGTYRDRRNARRGLRGFIRDDSWVRDPAADIANHLDSPGYHVLG